MVEEDEVEEEAIDEKVEGQGGGGRRGRVEEVEEEEEMDGAGEMKEEEGEKRR